MKGGSRATTGLFNRNKTQDFTTPAIGGALAGTALSSATSTTSPILTSCPPEDQTFMCKLNRFYNSVKMILGLIVILVLILLVIWFAYRWYKSR